MSILNDAINDAALLQEAATKIAQEKIVKALTPRIKKIIEAKLLNEKNDLDNLEIVEAEDGDADDNLELQKDLFGGSDMGGGGGSGMGDDYGSYGGYLEPPDENEDEELEEVVFDMGDQINEEKEINNNFIKENLKRAQNNLSNFKLNQKNKILIKNINESSKIIKKRSQETKNLKEMKYLILSSNKLNESIQKFLSNQVLFKDEKTQNALKEAFTNLTKSQIFLEKKMRNKNIGRKRNLREMAHTYELDEMDEMDEMYEMDSLDELDLTLSPSNEEEANMLSDFDLDDINFDVDMGSFGGSGDDDMEDADDDDMGDDDDMEVGDMGDDEDMEDEDESPKEKQMKESIVRKVIREFKRSQSRKRGLRESMQDYESMARSHDSQMRMQCAMSQDCPEHLLDMLSNDSDPSVAAAADSTLRDLREPTMGYGYENQRMQSTMNPSAGAGTLRNYANESRYGRRSQNYNRNLGEASDPYYSFGGGKSKGHFVLDLTEEELINVLADEIGRVKFGTKAAPRDSAAAPLAKKTTLGEARLLEAKNNKLRKQLSEMKLFSAKLIYVNRLFEGNTVSAKQRRAIVEAMDNAKTLNEAKLLYKTLTQSLSRKSNASQGTLTENTVRVLGSSSRSTSSAQPAKNGVELDRWAVLAGLKG